MGQFYTEKTENSTTVWLTPRDLLARLGQFDCDPCACDEPRPWDTAHTGDTAAHITENERTQWNTTPTLKTIFEASPTTATLADNFTAATISAPDNKWTIGASEDQICLTAKDNSGGTERQYIFGMGEGIGARIAASEGGILTGESPGIYFDADGIAVKNAPLTVCAAQSDAHAINLGQAKTLFLTAEDLDTHIMDVTAHVSEDRIKEIIDERLAELGLT